MVIRVGLVEGCECGAEGGDGVVGGGGGTHNVEAVVVEISGMGKGRRRRGRRGVVVVFDNAAPVLEVAPARSES